MNYFEFYETPISFNLDEAALKKSFLKKSRQFHPDFYTLESDEKQAEVLELATYNTEAYKVLSDNSARMKYILELKDAIAPEGQNQLPQDFLMEAMEINEQIMELEFDFDEKNYQKIASEIENLKNNLKNEVEPILQHFDFEQVSENDLEKIKNYYFKSKYCLRMSENVSKFASL